MWVVFSDFQKGISDFTIPAGTNADGPVRQIGWVGDDAVAITWEGGRVVIMGPTGGYLEHIYNEGVWVIEEVDGLRIYSSNTCEFVQKVAGILSTWRVDSNIQISVRIYSKSEVRHLLQCC